MLTIKQRSIHLPRGIQGASESHLLYFYYLRYHRSHPPVRWRRLVFDIERLINGRRRYCTCGLDLSSYHLDLLHRSQHRLRDRESARLASSSPVEEIHGLLCICLAGDLVDPGALRIRKCWSARTQVSADSNSLQRVYELSEGYTRESEALRDQPLFIGLEGV